MLVVMTVYNYIETPKKLEKYLSEGIIKYEFNQLPTEYQEIVIKVQDPGFYSHKGIDLNTPGAGWTTITQSLAKFFYFEDFKAGWRKVPQTVYARFALHPNLSKELQLDLFINMLYYGNGARGILEASNYYLKKSPDELTKEEFISLIATLNNPKNMNPKDNPEANNERVRRIIKYLNGEYIPKGVLDVWYEGA